MELHETLSYPVLVIPADKLTATLRVQNVGAGMTECTCRPVLGERLFCRNLNTTIRSNRSNNIMVVIMYQYNSSVKKKILKESRHL